ncbi:MAG: hypothetical protein WA862_11570 [Solirubrobacterales bacterium]
MSNQQQYVWHHELHEKWGGERLYFWRLAFFPTYDRKAITDAIGQVIRGEGEGGGETVTSYAIYETLGLYDLVLRVWLPVSRSFQEFQEELWQELRAHQLQVIDIFTVGDVTRHWPWVKEPSGEMTRPIEALKAESMTVEELTRGNEATKGLNPAIAKDYAERSILAPCPRHDGIKFIIVVTATAQLTTMAARRALRDGLLGILLEASPRVASSLYEGSGFGQFLILGGVAHDDFGYITTDVIEPIIASKLGAHHGARPYTYLCTGTSNPLEFEDVMPVPETAARRSPSVEELLKEPEGLTLEVKSSSFVNVDRWLLGDGNLEASDEVFDKGVAKAVLGMLNAEGGEVVIGAIEKGKYPGVDLSQLPSVGEYACVGVDLEYGEVAADWDSYALHLGDKLNSAIEPPPTGLISIVRSCVAEKDLAVLRVGATSGSWFYLKTDPRLYVRTGNATHVVSGPTADFYRAAKARLKA